MGTASVRAVTGWKQSAIQQPNIYLVCVRISQAHAQDGWQLDVGVCVAARIEEQCKCRIVLVRHSGAGQPNSQRSTPHHVGVLAVLILIHLGQATFDVPQGDEANAGGGSNFCMVLVLENPVYLFQSIARNLDNTEVSLIQRAALSSVERGVVPTTAMFHA